VPQLRRICASPYKFEYVLGVAEKLTLGCIILELRRTVVALLQGTFTLEGATYVRGEQRAVRVAVRVGVGVGVYSLTRPAGRRGL
jgi:hypothetical protein